MNEKKKKEERKKQEIRHKPANQKPHSAIAAVGLAEQRGSGAIQAAMPNRVLYLLCTVEVGEIKIDIRRIIRSTICT